MPSIVSSQISLFSHEPFFNTPQSPCSLFRFLLGIITLTVSCKKSHFKPRAWQGLFSQCYRWILVFLVKFIPWEPEGFPANWFHPHFVTVLVLMESKPGRAGRKQMWSHLALDSQRSGPGLGDMLQNIPPHSLGTNSIIYLQNRDNDSAPSHSDSQGYLHSSPWGALFQWSQGWFTCLRHSIFTQEQIFFTRIPDLDIKPDSFYFELIRRVCRVLLSCCQWATELIVEKHTAKRVIWKTVFLWWLIVSNCMPSLGQELLCQEVSHSSI